MSVAGTCAVCGTYTQVKYCNLCHAYICDNCRPNIPARMRAAMRRLPELRGL